jgi:hypothetical protein
MILLEVLKLRLKLAAGVQGLADDWGVLFERCAPWAATTDRCAAIHRSPRASLQPFLCGHAAAPGSSV